MAERPPRRLVLLRHGRSEWNAVHRIQGQSDPGLDDTGLEQARAVAPEIAKLGPVVLWSSDLARARQTAAQVAAATGLEPTYDARLREFGLGEVQGLTHDELAARSPELYRLFRAGEWDRLPGAETRAEVVARFTAAVAELTAALPAGSTGVAVAHGAAIRTAVAALLGWPVSPASEPLRGLDNCGWAELVAHDSRRWQLQAYNRVA